VISFKGRQLQHRRILPSVRWSLAYILSYLDIEEIVGEHGFEVGHSGIHRGLCTIQLFWSNSFGRESANPVLSGALMDIHNKATGNTIIGQ